MFISDKTQKTSELIDRLYSEMSKETNFQEKLVRYSEIGMIIIDRHSGQFVFANPAAQRTYNRTLQELQELTLTAVTEIDFVEDVKKGINALAGDSMQSYKLAKVFVIPPDNSRKVAFMELVEIASDQKFPYFSAVIIEKAQLEEWIKMVNLLG